MIANHFKDNNSSSTVCNMMIYTFNKFRGIPFNGNFFMALDRLTNDLTDGLMDQQNCMPPSFVGGKKHILIH